MAHVDGVAVYEDFTKYDGTMILVRDGRDEVLSKTAEPLFASFGGCGRPPNRRLRCAARPR